MPTDEQVNQLIQTLGLNAEDAEPIKSLLSYNPSREKRDIGLLSLRDKDNALYESLKRMSQDLDNVEQLLRKVLATQVINPTILDDVPVTYDPYRQLDEWDDFVSWDQADARKGKLRWNFVGNASSLSGLRQHPGIVKLEAAAGAGAIARISLAPDSGAIFPMTTDVLGRIIGLVNCEELNFTYIRLGVIGRPAQAAAAIVDGIYFESNLAVVPGNWDCVCRQAGAETRVDSGIINASNNWFKLEFIVGDFNPSTGIINNVDFFIEGAHIATIAANIPFAGTPLNPCFVVENRTAAGVRAGLIDFFRIRSRNFTELDADTFDTSRIL
jgi:hypothetical protein